MEEIPLVKTDLPDFIENVEYYMCPTCSKEYHVLKHIDPNIRKTKVVCCSNILWKMKSTKQATHRWELSPLASIGLFKRGNKLVLVPIE